MAELILIGVIAFFLLIFVIAIGVFFAKKSKGKIGLEITDYNFSPGKIINGKVNLQMKKLQQGIVKVGLEGIYKNTNYNKKNSGSSSRNVYNFEMPITQNINIPIGESNYSFKFQVPGDVANILNSGTLGTAVKTAQFLLSGSISRIDWYFYAILDVPGVNLIKRIKVSVSGRQAQAPGAVY